MRVIFAKPRGFCAGVERAIAIVETALARFGSPLYVKHAIVHNRHEVERLKGRGMDGDAEDIHFVLPRTLII